MIALVHPAAIHSSHTRLLRNYLAFVVVVGIWVRTTSILSLWLVTEGMQIGRTWQHCTFRMTSIRRESLWIFDKVKNGKTTLTGTWLLSFDVHETIKIINDHFAKYSDLMIWFKFRLLIVGLRIDGCDENVHYRVNLALLSWRCNFKFIQIIIL